LLAKSRAEAPGSRPGHERRKTNLGSENAGLNYLDYEYVILIVSFTAQVLAGFIGDHVRKSRGLAPGEAREFDTVKTAALTLLALLIGFSFSMAISRYDERKNYEELEANAIGTEFARAALLRENEAAQTRDLLRSYLDVRISFYLANDDDKALQEQTAKLQNQLWSAVLPSARAEPTQIIALVVSGMNDVLNSQGFTQAAWLNRIPHTAWILMALIAIFCNLLVGYGEPHRGLLPLLVLPLIVSVSLFLIADMDSPRTGLIRIQPVDLILASQAMKIQ
jgi:hypothetical protein